ncbi:hypothetical protein HQ865_01370 [Mucilaginibacter mali]|uniref:Uncharacterized protein n=1 Tax=Mucilaginibacter mali TaxID=2740462 RepID=A0A7D4Q686_9SPHI|nr:hypothetical protein [Mucilaginibacter mali]QKJ28465.1 hypothetical protein HQ865_01370 [Mucilaginibacter mali]
MADKLPIEEFEKEIATAGNDLYLTNYRLRYYRHGVYYSIRLSEISYVEYERRHIPRILTVTLYIAAFAIAVNLLQYYTQAQPINLAIPIAVVIIGYLIYQFWTVKTIKFSSSGGGITVNANSLTDPQIDRFIELTENAIFEYTTRKPIYRIQ